MPTFTPGLAAFALAGLGAATLPVIIHLLNRRRFRTLHWAPMEFLQQAMIRSHRMLELRDVLLMLVRTAALLLFGLALARPSFPAGYGTMSALALLGGFAGLMCVVAAAVMARAAHRWPALVVGLVLLAGSVLGLLSDYIRRAGDEEQKQAMRQPVHAILIIDNSMSMAYRETSGTLLDTAKKRAKTFLDDLPAESGVTVIPLCGGPGGSILGPYMTEKYAEEDALEAIDNVQIVDRAASAQKAAFLAEEARKRLPGMTERVVLLSDQQRGDWSVDAGRLWRNLSSPQIVDIRPDAPRANAWIETVELPDGAAASNTPAVIAAIVRYEAPRPRPNTEVVLKVRGAVVETRPVDLLPGQIMRVVFKHTFTAGATPERPVFVPISVSISPPDRLPQDDTRHRIVPVVEALPVLFVDQYGKHEDLASGTYGETIHMRRLLAPVLSKRDGVEDAPRLFDLRHMTADRLAEQGRAALADVRLVVIAGVADPGPTVALLRDYVQQGGQLLIAAGGDFQPAAWNLTAWKDGAGILPAPLADEPLGKTPEEAGGLDSYFLLNTKSLEGDIFRPAGMHDDALRDLYGGVLFFKIVVPLLDAGRNAKLLAAETKRITRKLKFLIDSDKARAKWTQKERTGDLSGDDRAARLLDREKRPVIHPNWLQWSRRRLDDPLDQRPSESRPLEKIATELAEATRPVVLARFTEPAKLPAAYVVERRIGLGRIVFLASGVFGNSRTGWNVLSLMNAAIAYDRIMRQMIEATLPRRNETIGSELVLPIGAADRRHRFTVERPAGIRADVAVEVLEGGSRGLILRNVTRRGVYTVERVARPGDDVRREPFVKAVAFNGPASESQIAALDKAELARRMGDARFKWIGKDDKLAVESSRGRGERLWTWLIWSVLLLFVAERLIIAWPRLAGTEPRGAAA